MSTTSDWWICNPPFHYPLDSSAAAFPFPGNARNQKKTKHLKIIYSLDIKLAQESNGNSGKTANIPPNSSSAMTLHCHLQNRVKAGLESTNSSSPLTKGTQNVTTKTELGMHLAFTGIHLMRDMGFDYLIFFHLKPDRFLRLALYSRIRIVLHAVLILALRLGRYRGRCFAI